MKLKLRHCLLAFIALPAFGQKSNLHFVSTKAQQININKGTIFVNGNRAFQLNNEAEFLDSRRNKIIENKGNVFLFLEVNRAAGVKDLIIFAVNNSKVDSIGNTVTSDIRDLDQDGNLEFGGAYAAEAYPGVDSVYYVPYTFYEIVKGRVVLDAEYSKKINEKKYGVYIPEAVGEQKYRVISKKKR